MHVPTSPELEILKTYESGHGISHADRQCRADRRRSPFQRNRECVRLEPRASCQRQSYLAPLFAHEARLELLEWQPRHGRVVQREDPVPRQQAGPSRRALRDDPLDGERAILVLEGQARRDEATLLPSGEALPVLAPYEITVRIKRVQRPVDRRLHEVRDAHRIDIVRPHVVQHTRERLELLVRGALLGPQNGGWPAEDQPSRAHDGSCLHAASSPAQCSAASRCFASAIFSCNRLGASARKRSKAARASAGLFINWSVNPRK